MSRYYNNARVIGVQFNPDKQITGIGYGEYLKKTIWPDGQQIMSLPRAIATFTAGNWESGYIYKSRGEAMTNHLA